MSSSLWTVNFLGHEGDVAMTRAFTSHRKVTGPDSKMNRLYAVENRYTVTILAFAEERVADFT